MFWLNLLFPAIYIISVLPGTKNCTNSLSWWSDSPNIATHISRNRTYDISKGENETLAVSPCGLWFHCYTRCYQEAKFQYDLRHCCHFDSMNNGIGLNYASNTVNHTKQCKLKENKLTFTECKTVTAWNRECLQKCESSWILLLLLLQPVLKVQMDLYCQILRGQFTP